MPSPTQKDLHVNKPLSNFSLQYIQDAKGFIAADAVPICKVDKQSDIYPKWTKADWFRKQVQKISAEAKFPVGAMAFDTSNTYHCARYGLKKLILDSQRANADVDIDRATVNWLTQQILMARDAEVIATLLTASNWTVNYTGVAGSPSTLEFKQWNDAASDPFANFREFNTAMKKLCGRRASHLVVTSDVDDVLKEHSDALDKIKYTNTGIVTNDLLAAAFGVEKYLVADAVYESAAEGGTSSMSFMATKSAVLYFAPPKMVSKDDLTAVANFSWSPFDNIPAGNSAAITNWTQQDPPGEQIASEMYFQSKVVGADAGIFLASVIA